MFARGNAPMLRVGEIEYANCFPIFATLRAGFDCGGLEFVKGVPSELNRLLSAGAIDVSPSSSIEYGVSAEKYYLLPDLSISAVGPVKSVLLFSRVPIEELDGHPIALTSESDTSVNLTKIILARFYRFSNSFERVQGGVAEAITRFPAMLLIGDAALRQAASPGALQVYDLGELWARFTGLPFVFALWIIREEAVRGRYAEALSLSNALRAAKALAVQSFDQIAPQCRSMTWMGEGRLVEYWRSMSYDLTPRHLEGLRTFFAYAAELGLIRTVPEFRIFS